jgi:hypothetical protein
MHSDCETFIPGPLQSYILRKAEVRLAEEVILLITNTDMDIDVFPVAVLTYSVSVPILHTFQLVGRKPTLCSF